MILDCANVHPAAQEFALAIEDLLIHMGVERGLAYNYLLLTQRALLKFSGWLAGRYPEVFPARVSLEHISLYLKLEHERGLAAASLKTIVAALKLFFAFLLDRKLSQHDPTATLRFPKVQSVLPCVLNEQEAQELLAADFAARPTRRRERTLPLRDRAILELLYASGIRNSELVSARLGHLDLAHRTLRVVGKGQKERMVVFGRPAQAALADYLENERRRRHTFAKSPRDKETLFLSWNGGMLTFERVWQLVAESGQLAHLNKTVYPHLLRHSCATHLLRHGADLRVIQELLGHVNIATTALYCQVDITHLKEVHKRCHPRA